jgi:hypothetical protein
MPALDCFEIASCPPLPREGLPAEETDSLMRALFTLYLALVWLIVPYPYGLWLFVLSTLGFARR